MGHVQDGQLDAWGGEAGDHPAPEVLVGFLDLDLVLEAVPAVLDLGKKLDQDRDLERAGHGERHIAVDRKRLARFDMTDGQADVAVLVPDDLFDLMPQTIELVRRRLAPEREGGRRSQETGQDEPDDLSC